MNRIGKTDDGLILVAMGQDHYDAIVSLQGPMKAEEARPAPRETQLQLAGSAACKTERPETETPPQRKTAEVHQKAAPKAAVPDKLVLLPHLVSILEEAGQPLSVQQLYEDYCARLGLAAHPQIRRKIGVCLPTMKKTFKRVGLGIYALKQENLAADPINDAELMKADVATLSKAELEERMKRSRRLGNRDDACRMEILKRANSKME